MQLIPALDLLDNKVVRLTQGDYEKVTVYNNNPVDVALGFKDAGVKRLHLVDLEGARSGRPFHHHIISEIKKKTSLIIETGGGIRRLADFEMYYDSGLNINEDLIMIGSLPFQDPDEFEKIYTSYSQNILHTVDVWDREVKISGWKEKTNISIGEHIRNMDHSGINKYLVTQIKKDGMLSGPDYDLYNELNREFRSIEVIVSGGISSIEDVEDLRSIDNVNGFIVGRAFYENKITLEDIKKYQGFNE